jgi:leader peptidase (prepilin peptidase)/N-methyltransferase
MLYADVPPETLQWLAAAWLFLVGSAVGSFLNVVVYRLPAGMSIVSPGSHCPACKHPIRWHDNLPILSWLVLRGRCRDCAARISPRYPAVEAATGGLFLLLAEVELLTGGANLPARPLAVAGGTIAPGLTLGQAAGVYAYHLLLLCTLLAAALVEHDRLRPPPSLFAPAALVGLLAPLAWPHLHPVPAWGPGEGWLGGLIDGGAGLLAGVAAGCLVWAAIGPRLRFGVVCAAACVGLFLGWQAAVALGMGTAILCLPGRLARPRLAQRAVWIPATAWLGVLALGWILTWCWLVHQWPLLG